MRLTFFSIFLAVNLVVPVPALFAQPSNQETSTEEADTALITPETTEQPANQEAVSEETPEPVFEPAEQQEPISVQQPSSASSPSFSLGRKIVKAVEVRGNKTISIATILSRIKTRVGQEYLQTVISDDIKRLYNTGYFSDVSVDREDHEGGFKVIFYVEEKSIIENITFSKTRYYKSAFLTRKISSKKGKFLDTKTLKDDIKTIEDLYAKKGLTQVQVDVEKKIDALTNKVDLHFVIKEGSRVRIKAIKFDGNSTFSRRKLMRVIKSRYSWLFNKGYFKADVLEEDIERLKSFYEKEGFIDIKVEEEIEEINEAWRRIHFHIVEGKRYYVESIDLAGNKILSEAQILEAMKDIKVGQVFSREKLSVDISHIGALYFDEGYIFANVQESTSLNPDTGKVRVKLNITEGDLAYINRIKIQGNTRTRDIVIRRELKLYPGDKFDGAQLRRSKERLNNLGYFEDISYDIEDTDQPTKKDLIVQVKEAKTGSLSFGGGYSTIDQVVGFVEVEQRNFDFTNWPTFTGGGQDLLVRLETGSTRQNTRLSFTEPWLFDYPISFGFDAYSTERDRERDIGYAYDERRVGGDIRFGKRFTEFVGGSLTYTRENVKIGDFEDNVSADLLAEGGRNTVSSMSFNLHRDSRDSVFSPKKGLYLSGTTDVAGGLLGGDKDFYRLRTTSSYYVPFKFDSVFEFTLRTGIVDAYGDSTKVPIFERFFAGGARTIRGYNERKVGPLDTVTSDPIGGESMMVGNVEYTVPLIQFVKIAGFFDVGNVWPELKDFASGDYKSGTGFGLRVKTPIGPMNLDYGWPLNEEPGETDRSGKFYFSVSRGF